MIESDITIAGLRVDKKTMNQIATFARATTILVDEFDYTKFDVASRYLA